ncbi:Receptor-like protein 15 [Camellia lanceoleosa]|nr:Receptor-like protein 15 [Camellia lanceoleosa]
MFDDLKLCSEFHRMGWSFLGKFAMWVVIVLAQVNGHCGGCLEGERRGLFEFKDFLKSNGADADHLLPTWVEKPDHHSECCDWERVTYDRTTGPVTELFLPNVKDVLYEDFRIWFINASLFSSSLSKSSKASLCLPIPSVVGLTMKIADTFLDYSKLLSNLSKMRHLNLSKNNFDKNAFRILGALPSLKFLSLESNRIEGPLSNQGLCKLKKLEELDLSYDLFEGILPPCLSNMRSLKFFDISLNQFTGNVSPSLFGSLNSLEYIGLGHNRFEGLFSFNSFANHSNLEVVELISDNDKFEVETELTDWIPIFQLKVLLSNCNLNKLFDNVPKFLLYQNKLMFVGLSHNNLRRSFPNWLLVNNTRLEILFLRNNSFVNPFSLPQYCYISTNGIDVSDNRLSEQIQANIGDMFPYIQYLNLSSNAFEGGIPSSFVDFNLANIETLQLNDNQFTRPLTNVLSKLPKLNFLDISNNYMSSKIPSSMDNMTSLQTLIMRNNSFNGDFPCALVPSALLDISYNSFSRSILPSCSNLNLQHLKHMHLQGNKFTRSISRALLNSSYLLTLDIRDNIFFGSIPDSTRLLSNLRILLFRGNQLSGSIPIQLCQLNQINLMDLSNNYFNGSIPPCFSTITFGTIEAKDRPFMQEPLYNFGGFTTY